MDCFANACQNFGLTISLKKTNVMVQEAEPPSIVINNHTLDVVNEFTYLGSTITSNITLDAELDKRIGKASTAMVRLTKLV